MPLFKKKCFFTLVLFKFANSESDSGLIASPVVSLWAYTCDFVYLHGQKFKGAWKPSVTTQRNMKLPVKDSPCSNHMLI